jgi:hypothetical protein
MWLTRYRISLVLGKLRVPISSGSQALLIQVFVVLPRALHVNTERILTVHLNRNVSEEEEWVVLQRLLYADTAKGWGTASVV